MPRRQSLSSGRIIKRNNRALLPATEQHLVMIDDDTLVDGVNLARTMRVCRSTIYNWKRDGYTFLYGHWTTAGDAKAWLAERAKKRRAAVSANEARLREELANLR
jgi:hypothetical protein